GIGDTPETAQWSFGYNGNGIGWNVSVVLSSDEWIENNLDYLAQFVRATFELMAMEMFLANANNRGNRQEQIQTGNLNLWTDQTQRYDGHTVARRFKDEKARAQRAIEKAFDTQIASQDDFVFKIGSV